MIDSFQGEFRFLSNFWPSNVYYDGEMYPSVEHAYVAAKTVNKDFRRVIQQTETAGQVKRLGRAIVLRSDWEQIKLSVMRDLVSQKFKREDLAVLLLKTSPQILIEGNNWGDTFWGVCRGKGHNHLGKILMEVRGRIWKAKEQADKGIFVCQGD